MESPFTGHWLSPKNALFNGKISFLWLANTGVRPPIFKISRLKLQKLLKSCWLSEMESYCGELSVEITLLGLPHIVKPTSETWPNPREKVNSTLSRSFQQTSWWKMDVMPNVNFALSDSNNKDQLRDLYNYLNQKAITAINTYDSSTLGIDLITSHQVILCPQRSFQLKLLKITISIL